MKRLFIYITPLFFIFAWWCAAFLGHVRTTPAYVFHAKKLPFNSDVTPIDRTRLFLALNGDFDLMTRLIVEWDLEAQMLQEKGYTNVRRLERAQILSLLRQSTFHATPITRRYFPQTYLAAGILLAMCDEASLTSLPKGVRQLEQIFVSEKVDRIPSDSDPRSLEAIGSPHNTLAFISPYSQPCTLQVMEQRGIPMVDLGCITTPSDLQTAIETVGQVVNSPEKANTLSLFIDATLLALDNHLATRRSMYRDVLYVKHHTVFSLPTRKTLIGNLLSRLKINDPFVDTQPDDWSLPLDIEDIVAFNPTCIICSGPDTIPLERLKDVPAAKNGQIHFVDQTTQEFPSQHFLLGYYDLYDILMRLP